MPENKQHALARAKKLGFPAGQVVKGNKGYYIAPRGVTSSGGKKAYAELRSKGVNKASAAKVAHYVQKKQK